MSSLHPSRKPPQIVRIVLSQLGQLHAAHRLDDREFQCKLDRLVREELTPRHLALLVRELQDGTTRFIIKDEADNAVCDLVDCAPSNEDRDFSSDHKGRRHDSEDSSAEENEYLSLQSHQ